MAQQEHKARGEQGGKEPTALRRSGERSGSLARWGDSPFARMMAEMDAMFDQMRRGFFSGFGRLPHLDLEEEDNAIVLEAEVPGIDPKDLQLEYREGVLTIRAESRAEDEENGGRYRRYSSFYRQVALPPDADIDQAQASVKNGILTIRFPRHAESKDVKRIPIESEERRAA